MQSLIEISSDSVPANTLRQSTLRKEQPRKRVSESRVTQVADIWDRTQQICNTQSSILVLKARILIHPNLTPVRKFSVPSAPLSI